MAPTPILYQSSKINNILISPSKGLSKIDSILKGRRGKKILYLMSTVSTAAAPDVNVGRIYIQDSRE
jgi:hypothetical protein